MVGEDVEMCIRDKLWEARRAWVTNRPMLQAAMRLVYQLLLTLFAYSLGPVTP